MIEISDALLKVRVQSIKSNMIMDLNELAVQIHHIKYSHSCNFNDMASAIGTTICSTTIYQ